MGIHAIDGTATALSRQVIHRRVVAPLVFPFSSARLRKFLLNEIAGAASVLDVSCGDDEFILEAQRPGRLCVANDRDPVAVSALRARAGGRPILLTCGDARSVAFRCTFDVVVCKNTLHHLPDRDAMLECVRHLATLARRLLVVDIEDPRLRLGARLWNAYYRRFLADDGRGFLTAQDFQTVITAAVPQAGIRFGCVQTIKGRYLTGVVDLVRTVAEEGRIRE